MWLKYCIAKKDDCEYLYIPTYTIYILTLQLQLPQVVFAVGLVISVLVRI